MAAAEITNKETGPTDAEKINAYLESGGVVQIGTYTRSTLYDSRHVGWFTTDKDGNLCVRSGRKNKHRLTCNNGNCFMVAVRFYQYVPAKS